MRKIITYIWLSHKGDMHRVLWEHTDSNQSVLGGQEGSWEKMLFELS